MVKGEIWRAHLPFPRGSEPANDRPVFVIQGDEFNSSRISTVICAVITTNLELAKSPPNLLLEKTYSLLKKSSVINFSQIITLDKSYFIKMISMLSKQFIEKIDKALLTIFDIKKNIKRRYKFNHYQFSLVSVGLWDTTCSAVI